MYSCTVAIYEGMTVQLYISNIWRGDCTALLYHDTISTLLNCHIYQKLRVIVNFILFL